MKTKRLEASRFYNGTETLRLHDVVYLPGRWMNLPKSKDLRRVLGQDWFREKATEEGSLQHLRRCKRAIPMTLSSWYVENFWDERRLQEPVWAGKLPRSLLRHIRADAVYHGYGPDSQIEIFQLLPTLPFIGFGLVIEEGGLFETVWRSLPLDRLSRIGQLGMLHLPVIGSAPVHSYDFGFKHSRYEHSVIAYAVANLLCSTCGLNEEEALVLRLAALTHDILTPAGSDTVKQVDPVRFDEDVNYIHLFSTPGWHLLEKSFRPDREMLLSTIAGEGHLGGLLDFADKVSYTLTDVKQLMRLLQGRRLQSPEIYLLQRLVVDNPLILGLWDQVELRNGQVIVASAQALARFLLLRTLMFRILYLNPAARLSEEIYGLAVRYLCESKVLTVEQLLWMVDHEVHDEVARLIGDHSFFPLNEQDFAPRLETFGSEGEALAWQRECLVEADELSFVREHRPIKPALDRFQVLAKDGSPGLLRDVLPAEASDIQSLTVVGNRFAVYSCDLKQIRKLSPDFASWLQKETTPAG